MTCTMHSRSTLSSIPLNLPEPSSPLPTSARVQATGQLHPIAVLNVNYGSGSEPNVNLRALDELDDVFTRRFFFFDSVSGYDFITANLLNFIR